MMRPRDPRIRQTLNQISSNLESANETVQEGLYTFSQNYISPCFASIGNCMHACTAPCLRSRGDQLRRRRQSRAEANFDFYDDWDNDIANDSLLGWGSDELDRLLAGSGLARGAADQPRRQRKMSYGTRNVRRKSSVLVPENRNDPTVIPSSSFLGFLERFPWRLGARGQKYRPSAADLQEHPGGGRRYDREGEPLLEPDEGSEGPVSYGKNGRDRSATQSSRETTNSLSSRGDLIPSDEEADAVPLDDEFALVLGRRGTGLDSDDQSGRKPVRRSTSGTVSSTTDASLKELRMKKKRSKRVQSPRVTAVNVTQVHDAKSLDDLKKEEEQTELKEEQEVVRKRLAAQRLASNRGLEPNNKSTSRPSLSERPSTVSSDVHYAHTIQSPRGSISDRNLPDDRDNSQTEPFPSLPQTPVSSTGHESWPDNPGSPNPGSDGATDS